MKLEVEVLQRCSIAVVNEGVDNSSWLHETKHNVPPADSLLAPLDVCRRCPRIFVAEVADDC
jgi:hypothetical protein